MNILEKLFENVRTKIDDSQIHDTWRDLDTANRFLTIKNVWEKHSECFGNLTHYDINMFTDIMYF